ncbi:MAG TPA: hypothetical protein VFN78_12420 [Ktedonobacterales bacterium]|nr:hypothetical protein [Ktedonobacterales bacterium]
MDDEREATIDRLPELIAALPERERSLAERLFQVVVTEGEIDPPQEMGPWLERTFGSVEATRHQRIVRVMNRWTFEGATFNPLRSRRPGASNTSATPAADPPELRERIERAQGDDFCNPETRTPADSFGRAHGAQTITASNVAKADGWHGVAIFSRHDPLAIDEPVVSDLLSTSLDWAHQAHRADPGARHFFLLWNCLWRAGASLIHGHAQMTLSHAMAHARVEGLRAASERYHAETGGEYFTDLAEVHEALGLRTTPAHAVAGFASLTPVKEREVTLLAFGAQMDDLSRMAAPLWQTLRVAMGGMGVRAFNVALYGPPLDWDRSIAGWSRFPVAARFVDRGAPLSPTSDIAALELFGSSVISSDPFDVARTLRAEAEA